MQAGQKGARQVGAAATLREEIAAGVRLAVLLGLFGSIGPFAIIVISMQVYAYVIPTGSMSTLAGLVVGFAVIAVIIVAIGHARDVTLIGLSHRVARKLALPSVMAATARPGVDQGRVASDVLRDVEEVRRGVTGPVCTILLDLVFIPMTLLFLASYHWFFLLIAGTGLLVALILGLVGDRLLHASLTDSNTEVARGTMLVADAVRCAEAVEAMGMLPALVRRWAGTLARGSTHLRSAQRAWRIVSAATMTVTGATTICVMILGTSLSFAGVDLGNGMMICVLVMTRIMAPIGHIGTVLADLESARAAWRRIDALLRSDHDQQAHARHAWPCPHGRLSVENVTFGHPGSVRPLLRDISFRVEPGEVVALAGPPGSGKSTLIRLILGIDRPAAGHVYLDGHATWQWDRPDLARHLGFLPQDPVLPGGTVGEMIARLDPHPDMQAVMGAARLAGAERMIAGLPRGYATELGGAVRLSMGQRQRIALARAVFGSPRLVVLDEPAAYLDEEGERAVARLLTHLGETGTAVVFTSHRDSLLRCAKRVLHLAGPPPAAALAAPAAKPLLTGPAAPRRVTGPAA